jgi:hypothetical protein
MHQANKRRTITPPRLAKEWGVSTTKVDAFIKSGELRAINLATDRTGRPRYVIYLEDVERFLRSREVVPAPKSTSPRLRRKANPGITEFF